ncbi:adenylyltransferase and sulfurtransferase MOCS3 isoform X2 [Trichoplusia ni]|uniref:Adenylyltransferase and sulfurtransferase MOCS3 homolog n=1 Tax=Trichoplusia ni TaxID=7111 RepID=A0A7E5X3X3_TRINI|nr:adenylyltransferase and sulfurtransferase MOCS3 isoform X2 [Trichoplusia ni]
MSKMEQLLRLETEIRELRKIIQDKEEEMLKLRREVFDEQSNGVKNDGLQTEHIQRIEVGQLPKWAIERYSRQILLREIGVKGQSRICQARVLIVGAGGLGCPAGLYLAGAGVGEIGIIDYDVVELTNIHRQVLHFEHDQNVNKAESAAATLRSINSRIKITPYKVQLDSKNALEIAANYDVILDCTDNVPTRYLLSDLSCLVKKPLISGSALKMEGQLTIYGYRADNQDGGKEPARGPCYRCVFPSPPPAAAVGSCSAHGVAGPVPGVIGTLQAMEALKYIVDMPAKKLLVERMLIFDAEDMTTRTVRLRKRNVMCAACSDNPTITHLVDYEAYCMAPANDKDLKLQILPSQNRITALEVSDLLKDKDLSYIVDVRADSEFLMCHLSGAENWPIDDLNGGNLDKLVEKVEGFEGPVIFLCRRGNDSQIAAKMVLDMLPEDHKYKVRDMIGGLHSWAYDVDSTFPVY